MFFLQPGTLREGDTEPTELTFTMEELLDEL